MGTPAKMVKMGSKRCKLIQIKLPRTNCQKVKTANLDRAGQKVVLKTIALHLTVERSPMPGGLQRLIPTRVM